MAPEAGMAKEAQQAKEAQGAQEPRTNSMPHVDLLELPYFEGISMDDLVSFVDLMEPRQYSQDAVILREGDPAPTALYIAISGRVLVTKTIPEQHERSLAEFDSPTLFGEIELFCQIPPAATVKAVTPVSCFALNRETFDRLFSMHHPGLMRFIFNVARVACHRLAIADEMMARILPSEDLVNLRRVVFAATIADRDWPEKTGFFRRPQVPHES
jgi:CRP-like cAMP-binding protein